MTSPTAEAISFTTWKELLASGENVTDLPIHDLDVLGGLYYGRLRVIGATGLIACHGFYVHEMGTCATNMVTDGGLEPAVFHQTDHIGPHQDWLLETVGKGKGPFVPFAVQSIQKITIEPSPRGFDNEVPALRGPLSHANTRSPRLRDAFANYR